MKIIKFMLILLMALPMVMAASTQSINKEMEIFIDGNNVMNATFNGYAYVGDVYTGDYFGILNHYSPESDGTFLFWKVKSPESNITMNINYTDNTKVCTVYNMTEIQNPSDLINSKTIVYLDESEYVSGTCSFNINSGILSINTAEADPTTNVDKDSDGYTEKMFGGDDCNDNDAAINPSVAEVCANDLDDNCNGQTDEGVLTTYYQDSDGDGYGNNLVTQSGCSAPLGYVTDNTDCDDGHISVNPGVSEICDALDDNCDGAVDEGFNIGDSCQSDSNTCGDSNTGNYVCSQDGLGTECNALTPSERPAWNQICTSDANSCGDTDAGLTDCNGICQAVMPVATDTDQDGVADCIDNCKDHANPDQADCNANGVGDACDSINPGASDANCDGKDNDCNGIPDDGYVTTSTTCGVGACAAIGQKTCVAGAEVDSCSAGTPSTELCDGLDNDCNGIIDNGLTMYTHYTDSDSDGYGIDNASSEISSCYASAPAGFSILNSDCNDNDTAINPAAADNTNDGIDNDCDGSTDEDYAAPAPVVVNDDTPIGHRGGGGGGAVYAPSTAPQTVVPVTHLVESTPPAAGTPAETEGNAPTGANGITGAAVSPITGNAVANQGSGDIFKAIGVVSWILAFAMLMFMITVKIRK
ncbi:MAG: MopE-related protein [Candidatus Woesearchaeota archaeon]|nr:MopE-related protein [Candidatus Woesearchaeota archaeon]